MAKPNSIEMSGGDILTALDNRIKLLQNIKVAIAAAWGIELPVRPLRGDEASVREVVQERQTAARGNGKPAKPPVKKRRRHTGGVPPRPDGTHSLIFEVLKRASEPLSPNEIFNRMQRLGWVTTSSNPRGLVGVTLRSLQLRGKIKRVGNDYELLPREREQQPVAPAAPEVPVFDPNALNPTATTDTTQA